ncbi:MAG: transcriptional repressor [Planctomycetota bacterium]|nr:transcriptional repressor [Planctomycetota bacterium]
MAGGGSAGRRIERMTAQRRAILEELRGTDAHPSATELYEMVRRRLPRISLGTVYRNLEIMSEEGLALKLEHAGAECRFDGNVAPHSHVRCLGCGRISDVPMDIPRELVAGAAKASGYRIAGCRLEFDGWCRKCGRKRRGRCGADGA